MEYDPSRRRLLAMIGAAVATLPARQAHGAVTSAVPRTLDLDVTAQRTSRITHWLAPRRRGTILFSHGSLSSPARYDPLILPWVAAGYDVWAPLHVDSPDHPHTADYTGPMRWRARIEDMRALSRHLRGVPRIAAGHSYGALVALTLGGAAADVPEGLTGPLNDPQVTGVIAFSPPGPVKGLISEAGYAALAVPALIQTGDRDVLTHPNGPPPAPDAWRAHLAAYDAAAPGGQRYSLVLKDVDHFFGGLICWLGQPGPPQSGQLSIASDISRLFLDSHIGNSRIARAARATLNARLSDQWPVMLHRK